MDQLSFASLDFAAKKKRTKRDVFLAEMAAVVPWDALEAVIERHYPKMGPLPAAVVQFVRSGRGGRDIQSMRAFAGLELGRDEPPSTGSDRRRRRHEARS